MPTQVFDNEWSATQAKHVDNTEAIKGLEANLEKTKRRLAHFEKRYTALTTVRKDLHKRRGQIASVRGNPHYNSVKFANKFQNLTQYVEARTKRVEALQKQIFKHQQELQQKACLKADAYGEPQPTLALSQYNDALTIALSNTLTTQLQELATSKVEYEEKKRIMEVIKLKDDPTTSLLALNDADLAPVQKHRSALLKKVNLIEQYLANEKARPSYEQFAEHFHLPYENLDGLIETCNELRYKQTGLKRRVRLGDVRQFSINYAETVAEKDVAVATAVVE